MNSSGAFELEKRLRKVLVSLSANKVLKFVLQISKLFMKFKSFHTLSCVRFWKRGNESINMIWSWLECQIRKDSMIYIKIRSECLYINIFDS